MTEQPDQREQDEQCIARWEFAGLRCVRPSGHPGPHKGPMVGMWFNDAGRRIEGASAEDYA